MLTTLPNLLTLSRILAVPILVGTFYLPGRWAPWVACVLFSAAGITDWLDGHFARRWQQQTDFGRFLDPIADKLVVAAALFMLVAKDRISEISDLPALVILMREILAGLNVSVPVSRLAKWKTALQMVAIGVLLVGDAGPDFLPVRMIGEGMLWVAAVLTLLTGYDYLHTGLTHMDGSPAAAAPRRAVEPRTIT